MFKVYARMRPEVMARAEVCTTSYSMQYRAAMVHVKSFQFMLCTCTCVGISLRNSELLYGHIRPLIRIQPRIESNCSVYILSGVLVINSYVKISISSPIEGYRGQLEVGRKVA